MHTMSWFYNLQQKKKKKKKRKQKKKFKNKKLNSWIQN